ncbi:AAA family ATPase [Ornithinimicrobium sp. LYQ121]|uniref:AAA family ATPase n=1 Tax=Ornithinimicrobium sp. LYQ121 TaxID=3378801 RepID=UPI003851D2ED
MNSIASVDGPDEGADQFEISQVEAAEPVPSEDAEDPDQDRSTAEETVPLTEVGIGDPSAHADPHDDDAADESTAQPPSLGRTLRIPRPPRPSTLEPDHEEDEEEYEDEDPSTTGPVSPGKKIRIRRDLHPQPSTPETEDGEEGYEDDGDGGSGQQEEEQDLTPEQRRGLEVARHLIKHGVPVFIARPAMEGGVWNPQGGHDGTGYTFPSGWEQTVPDQGVLDRWLPGDALGAVMGHTVDGVDVDPYNGGSTSAAELKAAGGWPRSYGQQSTPSGGWHDLIRPLGVGSPRAVLSGVDLRGGRADGSGRGFLFIAPTVKISKVTGELGSYTWVDLPHLDDVDPLDVTGRQLVALTRDRGQTSADTNTSPQASINYAEMSRTEQSKVARYLAGALGGIREELGQAETWPEGHTQSHIELADGTRVQKSPRGWQKYVADVCQRLGQLARAEWTPWTTSQAYRALTGIVPDVMADAVPLEETWTKQHTRGAPAPFPATLQVSPTTPSPSGTNVVRLDVVTASDVVRRRVRYAWDRFIPVGAMTLMPGEEGVGKTTVGMRIIADLTRGLLPGEYFGTARDALILAPEDGIAEVLRPRLEEAGADLSRVHFVTVRIGTTGDPVPVQIPRDLPLVAELVREHDVGMVWIDSLITTLPDDMKSIAYKDVAKVLRAINMWAEEERVAVVAPWHLNKASGTDTAVRIMDSRAFRTGVRAMVLVVRDPDAPEGGNQGIVVLDKANAGRLDVPGLRYRIRSAQYVVDELDPSTGEVLRVTGDCGVVDWIGEVEGDALLLARQALSPRMGRDDGARGWLRDFLEQEGETSRKDVMASGREEGFSDSSVKRAARTLGVNSREVAGQTDGLPYRKAMWSLPSPASGDEQAHHTNSTDPSGPTGEN